MAGLKQLPNKKLGNRPGGPGRRDNLYYELFKQIPRDGDWYPVRVFPGRGSAYEAARLIRAGTRPVPGGIRRWEIVGQVLTEEERKGFGVVKAEKDWKIKDGVATSVLYARWTGPKVKKGEEDG